MIETALRLIDYFLQLLQKREAITDEYFERYVQPTYDLGELVFNDYINLLHNVERKIQEANEPTDIIRYLEDGRLKHLSTRMRLRSEISVRYPDKYFAERYSSTNQSLINYRRDTIEGWLIQSTGPSHHPIELATMSRFELGILGILMGGVAPFEDTVHNSSPYLRAHTLLNVLYRFAEYKKDGRGKSEYLELIQLQIEALKIAWQDVIDGYAYIKLQVAPTPSSMKVTIKEKKNLKYRREGD